MKQLALFFLLALLPSCSVVMASNRSGVDIEAIQNVFTKSQLLSLGAQLIASEKNDQEQLVETYKVQREQGSFARACMHGLLDIGTGFLWEFVGTPIEATLSQKKFLSFKATLDENNHITRLELN